MGSTECHEEKVHNDSVGHSDQDNEKSHSHNCIHDQKLRLIFAIVACSLPAFWVLTRTDTDMAAEPIGQSKEVPNAPYDPLLGPDRLWLMDDIVRLGPVKLGAPGIAGLALASTPMFEVMPRIWADGNVGKLPLLPYSAMLASAMMWCTYGFLANNPVVWTVNAFVLVLSSVYCTIFWKFCPTGADWLPLQRTHHVMFLLLTAAASACLPTLLPLSLGMTLLGFLASTVTVVMFGGPLAAVRTVLADRSTGSLPFGFTCAVCVNTILWTYFGWYMAGDPFIYIPNALGLLIACAQLSLFCRFGFAQAACLPQVAEKTRQANDK